MKCLPVRDPVFSFLSFRVFFPLELLLIWLFRCNWWNPSWYACCSSRPKRYGASLTSGIQADCGCMARLTAIFLTDLLLVSDWWKVDGSE